MPVIGTTDDSEKVNDKNFQEYIKQEKERIAKLQNIDDKNLDETTTETEDKKQEDTYVPGKKLVEELYQEGETLGERERYEGKQAQPREQEKDLVTEQREKFLSIYKESEQTGEGEQQDD